MDAQTFRRWECIVVNDTGGDLPALPSWVRVIEPFPADPLAHPRTYDGRFGGVAAARNAGIAASKAQLFLPVDADDMLEPNCLELMMRAASESGRIIYSDFWEDNVERGKFTVYRAPDWDPKLLISKGAIAAVTQLTPKAVWEAVGGYDPGLAGWEDWAFQIAYADKGFCASRLPVALWSYRKHTGMRREENLACGCEPDKDGVVRTHLPECLKGQSIAGIVTKFEGRFWDNTRDQPKEELMACRTCGGSGRSVVPARRVITPPSKEGSVLIEYIGGRGGNRRMRGASGSVYPFDKGSKFYVMPEDLKPFLDRPTEFRRAAPAEGQVQEPEIPVLVAQEPK